VKKNYLLAPGPTPVLDKALLAMSKPIIHHRTPEFSKLFAETLENLKYLYQTEGDVMLLSSSGTGAMEASVVNTLCEGDKVIAVNGGKFGERWKKLCTAYKMNVITIDVEWGKAVEPGKIQEIMEKEGDVRGVFTTMSETSTGTKNDIEAIAKIVSKYDDAILVVDAITGLGVMDLPVDKWGVDIVVSGSQKALMLPPGLATISVSQKAWKAVERSTLPKFYFDLKLERKAHSGNQTAFTPAVSLVIGLNESLKEIKKEGLSNLFARHKRFAEATREGMKGLGLKLLAPDSPSDALTAGYVPDGVDGKKLVKHLSDRYSVTVAGGQDHLKGKIIRIAHMGFVSEFDIITGISALEMSLKDLDYPVTLGAGVKKAQERLCRK